MPYSYPTPVQAFKCIELCHLLSNFYQPIHMLRYEVVTGEIFIIAGINEDVEITIYRNGTWNQHEQT